MTIKTYTFIWILSWQCLLTDTASLHTKIRNETMKQGETLELVLLNFTLDGSESFLTLLCQRYGDSSVLTVYNQVSKTFHLTKNSIQNGRVSSKGNTTFISNITFEDEGHRFAFNLGYSVKGEPDFLIKDHTLKEVQAPPEVKGTPLPQYYTVKEGENVNLTCRFNSKPVSTVTWEGKLASQGRIIHPPNSMDGMYLITSMATLYINNSEVKHNGMEGKCIAQNAAGFATQTVVLNVTYTPKNTSFASTPENPKEGERILISCLAVANPSSIVYEIFKNGKSVSNTSSGSYSFTSKYCTEDSGLYSCRPRNHVGFGLSKDLNLTVYGPPKIVNITKPLTINETQPFTLMCKASGCPSPSIVWIKDKRIVGQGQKFEKKAQPNDTGQYICKVSIGQNVSTRTVPVAVNYKPRNIALSTTATNGVVLEGQGLTINCSASGHPEVSYIIRFNNKIIAYSSFKNYATTNCRNHTGNYSCDAFNSLGSARTGNVHLSVEGIPAFSYRPKNKTVNESNSVTFTCKARGCPIPTIIWRRKDNFAIVGKAENLTFDRATISHSGLYVCYANSSVGFRMTTFLLTVQYKPTNVKLTASSKDVVSNHTVSITCQASGVPKPTYTFFQKLGINMKEISSINSHSDGVLHITKLQHDRNYKAIFSCRATNMLGSIQSSNLSINVLVPPTDITVNPKAITVNESDNVKVLCAVISSNPPPNFSWTKGTSRTVFSNTAILMIVNSNKTHSGTYTCRAFNRAGAAIAKVHINIQYRPSVASTVDTNFRTCIGQTISPSCSGEGNPEPLAELKNGSVILTEGAGHVQSNILVTAATFGRYTCRVSNILGFSQKTIIVSKQVVPGPPTVIQVTSQNNNLVVSWKQPICKGNNLTNSYIIYYKESSATNFTTKIVFCGDSECSFTLSGLKEETSYDISLSAVDTAGKQSKIIAVRRPPQTGKRKDEPDDKAAIYAGACGGVFLLFLIGVTAFIIYKNKKAREGRKVNNRTLTGTAMYDGRSVYLNDSESFGKGEKVNLENGSTASLGSKASSSVYKGTFGKKRGRIVSGTPPPSPALVKGEINNSFILDSDGAYEPASNLVQYNVYAKVNKKQKNKKSQSKPDTSVASSFAPTSGSTLKTQPTSGSTPKTRPTSGSTPKTHPTSGATPNGLEFSDYAAIDDLKFPIQKDTGKSSVSDNLGYASVDEL